MTRSHHPREKLITEFLDLVDAFVAADTVTRSDVEHLAGIDLVEDQGTPAARIWRGRSGSAIGLTTVELRVGVRTARSGSAFGSTWNRRCA